VLVLNETAPRRTSTSRCSGCGRILSASSVAGSSARCSHCGSVRSAGGSPMVLVRCVRCGRVGRVAPRVLEATPRDRICCPRCRALLHAGRMVPRLDLPLLSRDFPRRAPLGTVAVRCAHCHRNGYVPAPRASILGASAILCPPCRGIQRAPRWSPPAAVRPADPALARPRLMVGRPPEILARTTPRRPGPTPVRVAPSAAARGSVSLFEVRCFTCGRQGMLPVRPGVSLRPEEIMCPKCRPHAPSAAFVSSRRRPRPEGPVAAATPAG
jgi:DNA-directed RNA polymerase subunit RPC12/RpoP